MLGIIEGGSNESFKKQCIGIKLCCAAAIDCGAGSTQAAGVIAAGVARRINEIGVRMALGARAAQVLRMVMGETLGLAFVGIGTGLCAVLLLTRFLCSRLFGLKPTDPLTLVTAGLLLLAAAMLAGWAPARRASRIQPVQALRHE